MKVQNVRKRWWWLLIDEGTGEVVECGGWVIAKLLRARGALRWEVGCKVSWGREAGERNAL
jgi:hypothetical protein